MVLAAFVHHLSPSEMRSALSMSFWKRLFPFPYNPTLIANAVPHTPGIRVRDLPFALDKMLR